MRAITIFLTLFTLLLLSYGCTRDQNLGPDPEIAHKNVTLVIDIPNERTPSSYALSETDQKKVNELTVLLFKDVSGVKLLYESVIIPSAEIVNDGSGKMTIKLKVEPGNYDQIVLIANANSLLATLVDGTSTLGDAQAIEYIHDTGRWNTTTDRSIPMSALLTSSTVNGLEIGAARLFEGLKLIRLLARVDVKNSAHDVFKIEYVYLSNMNRNGLLMHDKTKYSSIPATPHIPVPPITSSGSLWYHYQQEQVDNKLERGIFIFEAPTPVLATISTSPRMIIQGEYMGETWYYPVDFTYDGSIVGTTKGGFMPIVRNHKYIFTIERIIGPGFVLLNDALATKSTHTNIVVSLLVVDEDLTDIFYDDNNYIGLSKDGFVFDIIEQVLPTENNALDVMSDAAWTVTCTEADRQTAPAGKWLMTTVTSGEADKKATLNVLVKEIDGDRDGYLIFRAAGLVIYIKVSQENICGGNKAAKAQTIGNLDYLTYRIDRACWMVEDSKEGVYTFAAENGNYYSYDQATQDDNACPAGWRVPSSAEADNFVKKLAIYPEEVRKIWLLSSRRGASLSPHPLSGEYNAMTSSLEGAGATGYWWIKDGNALNELYMQSDVTSRLVEIKQETPSDYCRTVRCIKNEP